MLGQQEIGPRLRLEIGRGPRRGRISGLEYSVNPSDVIHFLFLNRLLDQVLEGDGVGHGFHALPQLPPRTA